MDQAKISVTVWKAGKHHENGYKNPVDFRDGVTLEEAKAFLSTLGKGALTDHDGYACTASILTPGNYNYTLLTVENDDPRIDRLEAHTPFETRESSSSPRNSCRRRRLQSSNKEK